MNLVPIFRKVVLGAAEASLDIAGAAFLPGAWPILKSALEPVLERLKERLGGEDITKSPERAQKAVAEFEADRHLQEMLRSKLLEQLDALVQGQQKIETDVQKLMLIVTGDQKLLAELVGGLERIEQRLDEGVNLSDEAVTKLAHAVSRQAENSRGIRKLALGEMGPVAQLVERQVNRLQVRAVELVQEGALDRATDELQEGLVLIAALLNEAPTDTSLRLQLGFIYKTISQVFSAAGQAEQAQSYTQRAEEVFRFVKDDVADDQKTALDVANAIHGQGNVDQQRGDFAAAIEKYKLATALYSDHMYAWHDMFAAYYELARRGQIDLNAMRQALERLKQKGQGTPGLGSQHIADLEHILRGLEKGQAQPPAEGGEEIQRTADAAIFRVLPEFLSLVIGESDPYVAVFNLNCEIINESSAHVSIRKLEVELTTPESLPLQFMWNVFYDCHLSHLPESKMMTKASDAHDIEIEAGESTSLGIQFLGAAVEPQHFWVPGEYKFELSGWVVRQPGHDHFNIKTRFRVDIGILETNQVKYWSSAPKTEWDQLNDPDRAIAIPIRIDESSMVWSWEKGNRTVRGHG